MRGGIYCPAEPTNEGRAEAELVQTMPYKEEEDDSQMAEIAERTKTGKKPLFRLRLCL